MAEPAAAPPDAAPAPAPAAEAQPPQRFSLGAAAFGGVPDATCAQPHDQAPLAWQRLLVKHADPPALRGLFTSCRGGRDLVLQHADQATLTLPLLLSQSYEQWIAQHGQVKSALTTRGRLPTRLHLDGWDGRGAPVLTGTPLPLVLLTQLLQSSTAAGITHAVIESTSQQDPPPSGVTQVLAALPSLTRLELAWAQLWPLPPPAALPHLRDLCINTARLAEAERAVFERFLTSLAPYLPQLTSLEIADQPDDPTLLPIHLLFTPAAPAPHLTTLSLPTTKLTDELLAYLLDHAPALEQLSTSSVELESAAHRGRVWGLKSMAVQMGQHVGIEHLPACKAGKMRWVNPRGGFFAMICESHEGLDTTLVARLPDWQFDVQALAICLSSDLPFSDRPTALRNALIQLDTHLNTPRPMIEMYPGWLPPSQLSSFISTALPAQSTLRVAVSAGMHLTNTALSQATQMGTRVCGLTALHCTGGGVLSIPCPWDVLSVWDISSARLADVLSMPLPSGDGRRTIQLDTILLEGSLNEDVVGRLSDRLANTSWVPVRGANTMTVILYTSKRTPLATLRAQLALMRSLKLVEPGSVRVVLRGVPITHDTMAALSGLPEWPGVLDLRDCTWPLPAAEYTQLAQCVPTSYTEWHVRCDDAILDSICTGINERRARLGARPVSVYVRGEQVRRMGEHVVLRHSSA